MNLLFTQYDQTLKSFEEPQIDENPDSESIWVIPLGGLGEIGKNMTILESINDIIIIDAGIMFPTEEMLGIDYVIPDIRYLIHKKNKIRGIILTHGHEDHIGAIPYILNSLMVPIFGTKLTLEILKSKLKEFELPSTLLTLIRSGETLNLGDFEIDFYKVVHSISESLGLIIKTPVGRIIHSGDFKFDDQPVNGDVLDYDYLTLQGNSGIKLLMSDSTYADRPGYSEPEIKVGKTLDRVFSKCTGRIIISTFASSIPRIQQIISIAEKYNKRICIHGKSLENTLNIAREQGYINLQPEMIVKIEETKLIPENQLLILATGSQGEPLSALTLMAGNNHKWVKIKEGDTVIISATPVPGNESLVHNTINSLFRLGAEVIYESAYNSRNRDFHIHVSGHGSQEELKTLINIVKPEYFIPIHGEIRHLVHHARLANEMGIPKENIFQMEDGCILEISGNSSRIIGKLLLDDVMVDGLGIGDIGRAVLKDRQLLSENGICFAVIVVDKNTREILEGPFIETRGLIYIKESQELLQQAKENVLKSLCENKSKTDSESLSSCMKTALRRFFQSKIRRRPVIIPTVIDI